MPPQAQYTKDQRNYLVLEYHRRRGTRDFKPQLVIDFRAKFPGARAPGKDTMKRMWEKQIKLGTILNCNSITSPGDTHSGRPRTSRTPTHMVWVKTVMDRDAPKVKIILNTKFLYFSSLKKEIGDNMVSPVSSGRRNVLGLNKSAWWRLAKDLK